MAPETVLCGVPMLSLVGHLPLVHPYGVPTGIAVLGEGRVETVQAKRSTVPHHVAFATELSVALEAAEVSHVPGSALGFGAFVGEDYLEVEEIASVLLLVLKQFI